MSASPEPSDILDTLQPPQELIKQLKPPANLPVGQLLQLPRPRACSRPQMDADDDLQEEESDSEALVSRPNKRARLHDDN